MIARSVLILTLCVCFSYMPILVFGTNKNNLLLHDRKFLSQICQYLNDDPFFKQKQRRILTSIYLGPLLLYKTPHEVIGTPSHRNVSGIIDTYSFMNAQREEDAYMIIRRRDIEAILIGRPDLGIAIFFKKYIRLSRFW